ncbi:acetyl-CoA C-acetyltransferase [Desulfomonile tiedjei]|uniref:Acetyl-CoA acetyltransferase n=1 Tax=Desulfomonile tiedjei (strain ATCC 49306 / DSM 6799 / DCB-1) TaxID=706587 RepID=I4C4I3_DESTA|nr:acetyl-CoA C-acetyltransferase [Desulfomonile tiedjei]AFM24474.1 acetyl-CoA acetyltransferase [Desulfomonile tiedjei DSM 6799]
MSAKREAVIVSATRTPLGSFNGSLSGIGATKLGSIVIEEAVKRAGVEKSDVDEVIMGQVLPCGYGQNPARQAAIQAGIPFEAQCFTINKVCGSGLKAVMLAAQAIQLGDADIVIAGGMESMTNAPYYLAKARFGYRMGDGALVDSMLHDGLWDIVNDFHMGISNDLISEKWHISREDQDRYAALSYERALTSIQEGRFKEEIVPVLIPQKKGDPKVFDTDECPRETTYEALSRMKPAFQKDGYATAGNASIISDGAGALCVMSEETARKRGLGILARVGSQASAGMDMKYVLMAPILSIPKAAKKEGVDFHTVDLMEVNEAFAGSTVGVIRELGLDEDRCNVNGGSVALGHPIGASGARVLTTLLYAMKNRGVKTGMASLCLGGGEAVSLYVDR